MRDVCEGLLDLFFPKPPVSGLCLQVEEPYCQRCGEPFDHLATDTFVCTNCRGRTWHLSRARAAYRAQEAVLDTIHAFKYQRAFYRLPELGAWLLEGYDRFYAEEQWDCLIPVPLHPGRERRRTFNQAYELARWLALRRNLKLNHCLKRVKKTETQARLRRSQRLRNQAGAFRMRSSATLPPQARCLIIDDVFTTGATVNACARIVKRAGAGTICALTVARG
jgi:competence protein ComFC